MSKNCFDSELGSRWNKLNPHMHNSEERRESLRERVRETDRQTASQPGRQPGKQAGRQKDIQRERDAQFWNVGPIKIIIISLCCIIYIILHPVLFVHNQEGWFSTWGTVLNLLSWGIDPLMEKNFLGGMPEILDEEEALKVGVGRYFEDFWSGCLKLVCMDWFSWET